MGFREINFKSMSIFRILFGVYLMWIFAMKLPYLGETYTNAGMYPLENLTLAAVIDHPLFQALFITTHVLALIAFTVGYRTRIATIALFLTFICMYWRGDIFLSRIDLTARLLLLWSLFLPLGRYWSIDALHDPEPADRPYPLLPVFAMRAQIAMIYFFSGLYKLVGVTWQDGTAVKRALMDNAMGGTPAAMFAVKHLGSWMWIPTYGIVAFQLLFTALIYMPWHNNRFRAGALIVAAAMHISFIFFLRVGTFPYICLIYLILLVPDAWWGTLGSKPVMPRPPLTVQPPLNKPAQGLCAFLIVFALVYNLMTIPWGTIAAGGITAQESYPRYMPAWMKKAGSILQIDQEWSIFAPNPFSMQRRYGLHGTQADGTVVDLTERMRHKPFYIDEGGYNIVFGRSGLVYYFMRLKNYLNGDAQSRIPDFICRDVNRNADMPRIERIRFDAYWAEANEDFRWPEGTRPFFTHEHKCP